MACKRFVGSIPIASTTLTSTDAAKRSSDEGSETGLGGQPSCEVAYWMPPKFSDTTQARQFGVPGRLIRRHALLADDYRAVSDTTDYTIRRRRR